ncbi:MAG TPA: carboxypeptidase-like regulatory domain-containing protein [Candidatus Polarisedimenticolia bacterium]|jgi:hypothetical protein|nr:carboxypeptidase-like regulatory domain-containing protein [Candidatus Polarisedimenticolia bacterium]
MIESSPRPVRFLVIVGLTLSILQGEFTGARAQSGAAGPAPRTASITGRVFGSDRTTPVQGAVVRAVRGNGAQVFSSLPTDEKGDFALPSIVPGSYDIVVELPDGVYVVERTLSISEARAYTLSLAAVPADNVEKHVAAVDKPVKGYAWTLEGRGPKAGGFWRTPGGIAIIAGGVVGLVALAASGGDNNDKGSNSTP